MEDLSFRMYEPKDREKIYKLWYQDFDPEHIEKRKRIFTWLVEENPHLLGRYPPFHIVDRNGEVVGYYGNFLRRRDDNAKSPNHRRSRFHRVPSH
jgi:hypothetical protein